MTPTKSSLWKHKHPSLDKGSSWSCLRDARQRISSISILFADQAVFVALGCICNIKRNRFWTFRVGFNSLRGFTNGSSKWDFFYVHCHSLCFLYTLALQQLHITSTLNTFLPISFSTWCRKRIPGGTCRLEFSLYRLTTKSIILVKASAN